MSYMGRPGGKLRLTGTRRQHDAGKVLLAPHLAMTPPHLRFRGSKAPLQANDYVMHTTVDFQITDDSRRIGRQKLASINCSLR
jgi:hypothetical protein